MGVVRWAVSSAVVALVAGHQLSTLAPARREALWAAVRGVAAAPPAAPAGARSAVAVPARIVSDSASTWGTEETVAPDRLGQFQAAIEIGGQRLPAMVDTGASYVSLSYEDADRIGIRPLPADFKYTVSTANGHAFVAKVELPSVRLGSIEVRDVTALVSDRGQLGQTLLGMSFLSRLSSVKMDHGRLLLAR